MYLCLSFQIAVESDGNSNRGKQHALLPCFMLRTDQEGKLWIYSVMVHICTQPCRLRSSKSTQEIRVCSSHLGYLGATEIVISLTETSLFSELVA